MKIVVWWLHIAFIIGEFQSFEGGSFSREYDLLLPYLRAHDDPKRNIRHVRECQHILHGNHTYESFRVINSTENKVIQSLKYLSHRFSKRKGLFDQETKYIRGHIALINNPLKTISVLYPKGAASCSKWTGIRQTVSDTAKNGNCMLAINAGFFNTHTAGCLGNIISNGKILHNSNGIQNANFGIRRDGTIVIGYLSEDDVMEKENPFVQLVSGVGWLIRNGKVYTNESKRAECADTEETGTIDRFFRVVSARSAVGHDKDGRIIIATIDGKTDKEGVNLEELALILREHGAINAINLDGGGSATFVVNGTVTNYPSDSCGLDYSCEREVSSIICVRNQFCENCNCLEGRRSCVNGICQCRSSHKHKTDNESVAVLEKKTTQLDSKKDFILSAKREYDTKKQFFDENTGNVWFLSLTGVLLCSLFMNIFLVVILRVSKKRQEKPWRQGDLRGLLDDDSDGI